MTFSKPDSPRKLLSKASKRDLFLLASRAVPLSSFLEDKGFGLLSCPFHADVVASAKFFPSDEDGIERLFCFSCQKQYTSFHYIQQILDLDVKEYLIKHVPVEQIGEILKFARSGVGRPPETNKLKLEGNLKDFQSISHFIKKVYLDG